MSALASTSTEAGNQELYLGFPHELQGPNCSSHYLLPPRIWLNRKIEQKEGLESKFRNSYIDAAIPVGILSTRSNAHPMEYFGYTFSTCLFYETKFHTINFWVKNEQTLNAETCCSQISKVFVPIYISTHSMTVYFPSAQQLEIEFGC